MTREEAIHRLKNTAWLGTNKDREETEQAVDMAIEALQFAEHFDLLKEFQSLQEVVRCKDCRWWNSETNGCKRNPSVEAWYETDFCKYGERQCNCFGERREP